ncbi:MAG: dTMP kinase [Thermoplasmata archaeon]
MGSTDFLLIAIEGIDGAGKTTYSKLLSRSLSNKFSKVIVEHEPSNTSIGKLVKKISRKKPDDALLLSLLYSVDRIYHAKKIEKYKKKGNVVICDRTYYSTIAYQSYPLFEQGQFSSLDNAMQWNFELQKRVFPLKFNLKIYINVPVNISIERTKTRKNLHPFEKESYLKNVKYVYDKITEKEQDWVILDGADEIPKNLEKIEKKIEGILKTNQ